MPIATQLGLSNHTFHVTLAKVHNPNPQSYFLPERVIPSEVKSSESVLRFEMKLEAFMKGCLSKNDYVDN